ncbi:hypothetical protein E4U53_002086 [Claviceps sorghi]|nr:hypothetical protein E4U53_002086 [Claviceps sorghi]
MVRLKLIASVVAAAYAAVGAAGTLQGIYVIEVHDGHDRAAVVEHLQNKGSVRMQYDSKIFSGLSFKFDDAHISKEKAQEVLNLPSVKRMWSVSMMDTASRKHRIFGNQESKLVVRDDNDLAARALDTYSPHVMTQIDKLRAKNITGKGISIALVDTGIDFTHPALGNGCYGKGCLVSFGYDFVGDAYNGVNKPVPGGVPKDCSGHGTFMAGIVAAQKNPLGFTGAAPGVTLGSYRVFGCNGRAASDIVIAAFLKAFEDGANIISASIVQAGGWSEEPWAVVASRIAEAGVPTVISAGNDGNAGLFYFGSGASGKKVTAVASFDNTVAPLLSYHSTYVINVGRKIDFTYTPGDNSVWGKQMKVRATSLDSNVADDACKPLPDNTPDLSKYIVLVRRGGCDFQDKLKNLAAKGAQNILFYNDEPGTIIVSPDDPSIVKNTGMVSPEIGSTWIKLLKAGRTVTVNVEDPSHAKPVLSSLPNNVTGGAVSLFSSWGPTWEMDFKPQFGAPGSMILSTFPVAIGSYGVSSGTSLAAPITAGIMALIAEVRGTHDPELLKNLLSSTAHPAPFNDGNNYFGELAPAPQQGGGLVQAFDAAYTTTLLSPSSLSFNDTDHLATNLNFTLANKGKRTVTYKLDQIAALTMYAMDDKGINTKPFPNDAVNSQAVLTFSQNSITLAPGNSAVVGVTAKPATDVDPLRLALWSGYVIVNGTDGSVHTLPYQGLTGSLHKTRVIQPDQSWVFPSNLLHGDSTGTPDFTRSPDNTQFVLPRPSTDKSFLSSNETIFPKIYAMLSMGTRVLRVSIVPVTPGVAAADAKPLGFIWGGPAPLDTKGWTTFTFLGKLDNDEIVPEGTYQFVTQALKIFGDESKKEDWDIAITQPIKISYK